MSKRQKLGDTDDAIVASSPSTTAEPDYLQGFRNPPDMENPLTNTVILTSLFGMCPVDQLKVYRLVCKQWRDLSTSPWREKAVLHIKVKDETKTKPDEEERHYLNFRRLGLLEDLYKISHNPFQGIHIDGSYRQPRRLRLHIVPALNFDNISHLKISNRLLCITYIRDLIFVEHSPPLCSFILENVEIANFSIREIQEEQTITDIFPRTNVTLTRFELHGSVLNSSCHDDVLGTPNWTTDDLLRAVLIKAPNIHTLVASSEGCDENEEPCAPFLEGIDTTRLRIQNLDIKNIAFHCLSREYSDPLLAIVRDLAVLQLTLILPKVFAAEELEKFFGQNRKTLQKLTITDKGFVSEENSNLTDAALENIKCALDFPRLLHLSMKESMFGLAYFLFISGCPNLQQIELRLLPGHTLDQHKFDHLTLEDVKKLSISTKYRHDEVNLSGIVVMSSICPNLKELQMPMDKTLFRAICKHFPNITNLRVLCFGNLRCNDLPAVISEPVDDEAILGFIQNEEAEGDLRPFPKLTDLTTLTAFSLEPQTNDTGEKVYLTDTSVYKAFLKMPKLRMLQFNMEKVSKQAKEALQSTMFVVNNIPYKT